MGPASRRLRILLRRVLHTADTPQRTAAAFALGVFIGMSPFFGLHTVLALLLAFLLRLNRLAVLLGTLVLNPWTILPIYGAGTWIGLRILGQADPPGGLPLAVEATRPAAVVHSLAALGPYLAPFVAGNLLLGAAGAALAYPISRSLVLRFRRARQARRLAALPPGS